LSLDLLTFEKAARKHNFVAWVACRHHKTHKDSYLDFNKHKYQLKIYHDQSPYLVIIKSTQNGISEYLLVRAISHAINGLNVFYVLPTFELVKRFVDERYTKSVQNTPYYHALATLVKLELNKKQTESVKSKDIGDGNIAFVNSFSSVGFTEYPADEVIIDELDKCDQTNIEMAWERLSASEYRRQVKISNPTFKNMGIDEEYEDTDKLEWFVRCQKGHPVRLNWFENFVDQIDDNRYVIRDSEWTWDSSKDIRPICQVCGTPIDRNGPGEWVPTVESRKRGYRLTKLFTGTVSVVELLDRFTKGLKNDDTMQRFYNGDLGEAYTASGSRIDRDMIAACVLDYGFGKEEGLIIAGIDVGKVYNFVIKKMLPDGKLKTLLVSEVRETGELMSILREYNVSAGVIDGMPETREAKKISKAFKMMFLCYFGDVKSDRIDIMGKTITVQRTPAIDAVKEALLTNAIQYPINIIRDGKCSNFIDQMTASVRVFNADKRSGGQKGAYEWIEGNKPDHYLFATAYCLIARRLVILLNKR